MDDSVEDLGCYTQICMICEYGDKVSLVCRSPVMTVRSRQGGRREAGEVEATRAGRGGGGGGSRRRRGFHDNQQETEGR